jgi:hypothetical protein
LAGDFWNFSKKPKCLAPLSKSFSRANGFRDRGDDNLPILGLARAYRGTATSVGFGQGYFAAVAAIKGLGP